MPSEFLIVAEQVLERERRALSALEIVDIAIREGLFSDKRAGKTPHQTLKAKLSVNIRRLGHQSRFVRTAPGRFYLRRLLAGEAQIYEAPPLRPPDTGEKVLVFPTAWLEREGRFQGIKTTGVERFLRKLFASGQLSYRDRREAEQLDDQKQIIAYIMVTRGNSVLAFRRGRYNRVEDFLRGARCIGFGGHVTASDIPLLVPSTYGIREEAARELREELKLPNADLTRLRRAEGIEIVGLLNDDASPAGRRHFAVILRYEVSDEAGWAEPKRNEKSITELRWLQPETAPDHLFKFEYWSQLCLLQYYGSAQITQPAYVIRRAKPLRPPHVLLVLGELGSGKSATTAVLRQDYSYKEINSGRVVAELLQVPPIRSEDQRAAFQERAWQFIQSEAGPATFAAELWKKIGDASSGRVLVEGIRQRATIDELLRQANGRRVGIIFVHTPFNMAFEFYRRRAGEGATINQFIAARSSPVEQEAGSLVKRADAVLYNWKGEREHRTMIHHFMTELQVTP